MQLSTLTTRLTELVENSASVVDCEGVLASLDGSELGEFFESILFDPVAIEHIRRESFLHQPGFNRFVLKHDSKRSWRLRMNVWWPHYIAQLRNSLNIHNHVWDHTSFVLAGVLENHFYRLEQGADFLFYVSMNKGTPNEKLALDGTRSAKEAGLIVKRAGETYHQYHHQFHRISPQTDFLATLCFQTPPKTDNTFALLHKQPVTSRKTTAHSQADISALLTQAISRIGVLT